MYTTDRVTTTETFRSRANLLPGAKVLIGPWPTRSLGHRFPERIGPETFVLNCQEYRSQEL